MAQRMTTSDNECYNEWQRVTTSTNEWQRVTTIDTKNNNEWQRVTTSGTTNENKWKRIRTSKREQIWFQNETIYAMHNYNIFSNRAFWNWPNEFYRITSPCFQAVSFVSKFIGNWEMSYKFANKGNCLKTRWRNSMEFVRPVSESSH